MDYDNYIERSRGYYNDRFDTETKLQLNAEEKIRWHHIEAVIKSTFSDINYPLNILDAGCGDGKFSDLLSKYGNVIACDLADKAIARGKVKYPAIEFHIIDLSLKLPMHHFAKSFDIIVSTEVIEHILDQETYIDNLVNWLKPGGSLIVTTPNGKLFSTYFNGNRTGQAFEFWLLPSKLKDMLTARGLTISHLSTFMGDWFFSFRDNSFPYNVLFNKYVKRVIRITGLRRMIAFFFEKREKGLYLIIVGKSL